MSLTLTLHLPDETQALVEAAAAARHTPVGEVVMSFLVAGAQAEAAQRIHGTKQLTEASKLVASIGRPAKLTADFDEKRIIEEERLKKHACPWDDLAWIEI